MPADVSSEKSDIQMQEAVTILSHEDLIERAGVPINPLLTVVAASGSPDSDFHYFISNWIDAPHVRVPTVIRYMEQMRAIALNADIPLPQAGHLVFQACDCPVDVPSVAWEAKDDWTNVRLIPDLCYYENAGYDDYQPRVPPWEDRSQSLVWRGSSTGLFGQVVDHLDDLPRYRVCSLSAQLGARADVGFTDVVQAISPEQADLIRDRLSREGLMRSYIPMAEMAAHRFILDIDGNSNSWNFMMKLRLGCCVLRVESHWRQWFSDRLIAWEHYVPVAADLSDFLERAQWCFENPAECAAIAKRGSAFAFDMTFLDEMTRAARVTFAN